MNGDTLFSNQLEVYQQSYFNTKIKSYFKYLNDLFIPKSECQKESLRSSPKSSF